MKRKTFVFFKMAPSAIFYLFSSRSSLLTKIEGYFSFYACEMMIFYEQILRCATLKLRPNSLPPPRGRKFIYLERTRPDTRPKPVADEWAGVRMRVFTLSDRFQLERDGPTNWPTDQPTDGQSLL